ncbi:MAG: S8 family serine peptidase [Nocardioides sp.]|uniref:S8 family serine peptidase n=1 Tax=Nocardioides sp. TaxID=35761 RepID=UPI003D6B85B0
MRRLSIALLAPLLLALGAPTAASAAPSAAPPAEPAGKYIVRLTASAGDPAAFSAAAGIEKPSHVYRTALRGFSAPLTSDEIRDLRGDRRVVSIERVQKVRITDQSTPTGIARSFASTNPKLEVGDGVDTRVDADIAVLDTGISATHPDLDVVARTDCLNKTTCTDNTGEDGHGHGSHVAGTIAALDNGSGVVGVAPGARLWSVRVLDDSGSGQTDGIAAGIDWVAAHADEIEGANMSLGCECRSPAMDAAITRAVDAGVVFVVAAGNDHKDAGAFSPANHPDVVTVSALSDYDGKPGGTGSPDSCAQGPDDTLADFSNFGPLVEVAAPGSCIYSTYKGTGYTTMSGTSMASPHVAGAVAWLTSNGNDPKTRADVLRIRDAVITSGNQDWTDNSGDQSKEPLLDLHDEAVYPPSSPDPGAPIALATSSCSVDNNGCSFDGSGSTDPDGTITSWTWDFGDGTTGTGTTPSHTYPAAGYYSVILTVVDDDGKRAKTRILVKAGNLPPKAAIGTWPCDGPGGCTFDGSGSTDPEGRQLSYSWDLGDGTSATGVTADHLYPASDATYTVRLTVTDDKGQVGKAEVILDCSEFFGQPWCNT